MTLFRNAGALIISGIVVKGINVGFNFIVRGLLGPSLIGIWSLVQLAGGYLGSISVGIHLGAERQIPFYRGKGSTEKEDRVRRLMFTAAVIEGVTVGTAFLVYVLLCQKDLGSSLVLGFLWACAYLLFQRLLGCFITAFRTTHEFVFMSKCDILFACVDFIIIIPSVYVWGLQGLFISFGVGLLFRISYWFYWVRRNKKFTLNWYLSWKDALPVIRVGFPILIGSFSWQLLSTVDSLVIAKSMGVTSLGLYSLGTTVSRSVSDIPTRLSAVVFPRLVEKYGISENVVDLKMDILSALVASFLVLVPIVIVPAYFGVSFIVRQFLPLFEAAIPSMKWILMGSIFLPATQIPAQIFIAKNRMWGLILLEVCIAGGIAFAGKQLVSAGLTGVALTACVGYATFFSVTFFWVTWHMMEKKEAFKTYGTLMGAALYTILIVRVTDFLFQDFQNNGSFIGDFVRSSLSIGVAWIGLSILFWKADKILNIRESLRSFLFQKRETHD